MYGCCCEYFFFRAVGPCVVPIGSLLPGVEEFGAGTGRKQCGFEGIPADVDDLQGDCLGAFEMGCY